MQNLDVREWHDKYDQLQNNPDAALELPKDRYFPPDVVTHEDMKDAIDESFTAVRDVLKLSFPNFRPPGDDRAEQLVAAIARYAFGQ